MLLQPVSDPVVVLICVGFMQGRALPVLGAVTEPPPPPVGFKHVSLWPAAQNGPMDACVMGSQHSPALVSSIEQHLWSSAGRCKYTLVFGPLTVPPGGVVVVCSPSLLGSAALGNPFETDFAGAEVGNALSAGSPRDTETKIAAIMAAFRALDLPNLDAVRSLLRYAQVGLQGWREVMGTAPWGGLWERVREG